MKRPLLSHHSIHTFHNKSPSRYTVWLNFFDLILDNWQLSSYSEMFSVYSKISYVSYESVSCVCVQVSHMYECEYLMFHKYVWVFHMYVCFTGIPVPHTQQLVILTQRLEIEGNSNKICLWVPQKTDEHTVLFFSIQLLKCKMTI